MLDTVIYLGTAYLCFAFIKFTLCLPHIPSVICIMSRLSSGRKGALQARYLFTIPLALASLSLFGWVFALYREGFRFFLIYPKRAVIRDCVLGYRNTHN